MGRFADIKEPPPRCSLGKYLDSLPDEDSAEFTALLSRRDDDGEWVWSGRKLADIIIDVGDTPIDRDTIGKHRKGRCLCRATS